MRRQAIPDPIEHLDLHVQLSAACAVLEAEVQSGSYVPKSPNRLLMEKSKGLCRQIVVPSARDALVLQALSDALWVDLKKSALTKNAFWAPSDQAFSKPRNTTDDEYGAGNPWLSFQQAIFGFAKEKNYIVVTDIANYYDTISYVHLRNALSSLSHIRETALDLLLHILSRMLWQPDYMPQVAVGLPQMNLDAPRLLAHAFLFDLDAMLVDDSEIEYARYMDDIDIGIDDISKAKMIVRNLDLALHTRQMRLNSGKTQILSRDSASRHFKIEENTVLDEVDVRIRARKECGISDHSIRKELVALWNSWSKRNCFADGNGEKILKRLINMARIVRLDIGGPWFSKLLLEKPALRGVALNWWQHSPKPERYLGLLASSVESGQIVDDVGFIEIAISIVSARLPETSVVSTDLQRVLGKLDRKELWQLYAYLWMLSKYASDKEVMIAIEESVTQWSTNDAAARLVAGLLPRFRKPDDKNKLWRIVRETGNREARAVLEFQRSLLQSREGYAGVKNILLAPNPSLPNRLSHSKFLMVLAVLQNEDINQQAKVSLLKCHDGAFNDPYYMRIAYLQ